MNWNCNDKNKFHEIKILVHDATKIIIVKDRLLLNSIFFFQIFLFIANLFSLFYFLIFYSLQIASIWIFDANLNELKVTPSTWLLIASTFCYIYPIFWIISFYFTLKFVKLKNWKLSFISSFLPTIYLLLYGLITSFLGYSIIDGIFTLKFYRDIF